MKIKLLIIILLSLTLKAFALDSKMIQLRCESGAYPGQVKGWSYNQKDLFELYPNGYKRVYDVKIIKKKYLLAEEDAERGMYFVSIRFDDNDIHVNVKTPLINYTDKGCVRLK